MSSPEVSEDEYEFIDYCINWIRKRPPLIKKKSRIMLATVQGDIETLRSLLDSPKWYRVRDKYGVDLLRVTISLRRWQVFEYLLSLDDFPLETVGLQALRIASFSNVDERYVAELVRKTVGVVKLDGEESTALLYRAIENNYVNVVRLLIEWGVNLNGQDGCGDTPLHSSLLRLNSYEVPAMMLCYGADPFIPNNSGDTAFELILKNYKEDYSSSLESLLYLAVDQWSRFEISATALFQIVNRQLPHFEQLISLITHVTCDDGSYERIDPLCILSLFSMDSESLFLLSKKFPSTITEILQNPWLPFPSPHVNLWHISFFKMFSLENFNIIGRFFPSDLCDFISRINSTALIECLIEYSEKSNSEIIEIILYLLSYGMTLYEIAFERIYKLTDGYSDDFKMFLHMDVEKQMGRELLYIMPRLICDTTLNVDSIVKNVLLCSKMDWEKLFQYFAHPKLKRAHERVKGYEFDNPKLPRVPLLQELSRDAFRKHFVNVFQIETTSRFYTLIKSLQISPVHKKIITFETKLYNLKYENFVFYTKNTLDIDM